MTSSKNESTGEQFIILLPVTFGRVDCFAGIFSNAHHFAGRETNQIWWFRIKRRKGSNRDQSHLGAMTIYWPVPKRTLLVNCHWNLCVSSANRTLALLIIYFIWIRCIFDLSLNPNCIILNQIDYHFKCDKLTNTTQINSEIRQVDLPHIEFWYVLADVEWDNIQVKQYESPLGKATEDRRFHNTYM